MIRSIKISALAAALVILLSGCHKTPVERPLQTSDLAGQWALSSFSATKAVNVGGTSVDVYIEFREDGTFDLYQQIGQGWYNHFSGTFSVADGILSGEYSGGKSWGASYEVTKTDSTLQLSTTGGETYTYQKTTIPDSVLQMTY